MGKKKNKKQNYTTKYISYPYGSITINRNPSYTVGYCKYVNGDMYNEGVNTNLGLLKFHPFLCILLKTLCLFPEHSGTVLIVD